MNHRHHNKIGVGLRSCHYSYLESNPPQHISWFEIITENFLNIGGRPLDILNKIRRDFPIAFHGVSLNIAGPKQIDYAYLAAVKNLMEQFDPFLLSDHLCWTSNAHHNTHNLLPFPYNDEALEYVVERVRKVQDYLNRPILLENLSTYLQLNNSTYSEWEFLNKVCEQTGCFQLLDVNNLYVNSQNHHFDPYKVLEYTNEKYVKQMHLAGHTNMGKFLFDTHSAAVSNEVWQLYKVAVKKFKGVYTLIEWDDDIPEFNILEEEAEKALKINLLP